MSLLQAVLMSDNVNELTPIQQFYRHKCIFITGGTGFLGKILIEKLLRTCDFDKIYLLVRYKKGKEGYARIDELFNDPIFERLKQEKPKFRQKLILITGDCALPALGLNPDERIQLQRTVNIVFHVAATTRFNEKLKLALEINVNGTKEMLALCREMDHLKSVVHVSTAYANCNHKVIEEKFYEINLSDENAVLLLDCNDEKRLDELTTTLIQGWPNTYTFTKCLAEDLVRTTSRGLPIGVFRPAVVVQTYKEPVSGWSDNMFGPTGIIIGFWSGLLTILRLLPDNYAETVPVDMCVNSLITGAWEIASNTFQDPPIYNYVTSTSKRITMREYVEISLKYVAAMPMLNCVWYCRFQTTEDQWLYTLHYLYHMLPALIIDAGRLVSGKKPKMLQNYRKIHYLYNTVTYFLQHRWKFHDQNTKNLNTKLEQCDKDLFYSDMDTVNWDEFIGTIVQGIRKYQLKEDANNIPQAVKRYRRMKYLPYVTLYTIYTVVLYFVYMLVISKIF